MAKFEYKVVVLNLGVGSGDINKRQYSLKDQTSDEPDSINELGRQGWELVTFWDNPEPYLDGSYEPEIHPQVKLGIFKRQIN